MAQWIKPLTTDQEIPGLNPSGVNPFLKLMASLSPLPLNKRNVQETKKVSVPPKVNNRTELKMKKLFLITRLHALQ